MPWWQLPPLWSRWLSSAATVNRVRWSGRLRNRAPRQPVETQPAEEIVDEILIEFGQLRLVAYGVLIVALFLWMPRGVIPTATSLWHRVRGLEGAVTAEPVDSAAGKLETSTGESQSAEQ